MQFEWLERIGHLHVFDCLVLICVRLCMLKCKTLFDFVLVEVAFAALWHGLW